MSNCAGRKEVDYRVFGAYKGQLVRGSVQCEHHYREELKQALQEHNMSSLCMPDKKLIEHWDHLPTILKLMNEHSWTEEEARTHFKAYMKWIYTYARLVLEKQACVPIFPLLLEYVWRQYVQFSFDFFAMSQQLFNINYLHQLNFFKDFAYESLPKEQLVLLLKKGILALEEDWGSEYLQSIFSYETEVIRVHLGK